MPKFADKTLFDTIAEWCGGEAFVGMNNLESDIEELFDALTKAGYAVVKVDEIKRLREGLDEAQLRSIEARNPGIDIDEVRRLRGEAQ